MTDYYYRFDPNFEGIPYTPENTLGRKEMINFKCQQCGYNDEWWKFIPENITEKDNEKIAALCVCPKCTGKNIEEVKPCQTKSNTTT